MRHNTLVLRQIVQELEKEDKRLNYAEKISKNSDSTI